jgi:hypothetical protein
MTIFFFFYFRRLLRVLKWGLLFNERRRLTTTAYYGRRGKPIHSSFHVLCLIQALMLLALTESCSVQSNPLCFTTVFQMQALSFTRLYSSIVAQVVHKSVGETAAGLCQRSRSWFRFPSVPMIIFLFFPRPLMCFEMGPLGREEGLVLVWLVWADK